jgi:hypothetical protein
MSNRIHALAQQITGKQSLEECSLDELQHLTQRYPYFAPAQFLLLQKLRQSGTTEESEAQYRKSVLFYHDPFLFEQFISSDKFYVDEEVLSQHSFLEVMTEPEIQREEIVAPGRFDDQIIEVDHSAENIEIAEDTLIEEEDVPVHLETTENVEVETSQEEDHPDETEFITSPVKEETFAADEKTGKEAIEIKAEHTAPQEQATVDQKPIEEPLAFEPFHTVDYFASQGIKITQEELPKDKLGKQLKSFTEWLKTMKRLPATQIESSTETTAEKTVENMASHSVSESNVVTEAMAEVWIKQGNMGKALDIYNKLSLQNPSKKAYFAAKIENLKLS